jgi:hypothetical protein
VRKRWVGTERRVSDCSSMFIGQSIVHTEVISTHLPILLLLALTVGKDQWDEHHSHVLINICRVANSGSHQCVWLQFAKTNAATTALGGCAKIETAMLNGRFVEAR